MIRALVIIAVAGLLMAVGCISAAIAIGGPAVMAHSGWIWSWDAHDGQHGWRAWRREAPGPEVERSFPWSGDRLAVDAPAEIEYVQAAGPAKLTIRGPAGALDRVRVQGGRITLLSWGRDWPGLHIRLSAPDVRRFELSGADRLSIRGYKQDALTLVASGHAEIRAQGETKAVNLSVSGAGDADLAELKTAGAEIDISGAGQASVGPTDWARVNISGLGNVELLTRPKELQTQVSGAGRISQPGDEDAGGDDDRGADDGDSRGPARPT